MTITLLLAPDTRLPRLSYPAMARLFVAPVTANRTVQFVTLVQTKGRASPLISMVFTVIGEVPLSVTRLDVTLIVVGPLTVNGEATVASWLTKYARRSRNQFFTSVGATSAWPSQSVMPLATSALYLASITASYFDCTKA